MAQKGRGKGKGPELVFDDKARAEYLTGFRKRKQERKQAGRDHLAKKAKEEQLVARKELRDARKEKAAENVREQRKAFGLEAEGESDLDGADGSNGDEELADDDGVPQLQQKEYDSDEHHTHVVVEAFDPEQEAYEKATASTSTAPSSRNPKVNGASAAAASSSVEALPPSSRRVNKAKANASLSPPPPPTAASPLGEPVSSSSHHRTSKNNLLTSSNPFSASPSRPTGQGEETHHPHQEEDVAQKRLHISGLTASFSKEDLIRRFSTFGTVVALDGLGKRDALGQFRPYAYLTLQAPPQQIKRCLNLLSGSVWKGATLRIGEAKPDYQQRIQLENEKRKQEEEERANNPKKSKRLPPGMGVESSNMGPVDEDAVENGLAWGWKRTPAGHLVRSLRMRPAHPLPRPSRASTLANANAVAEGEEEQEASSSSRPARVNPRPPTKAHRITIDPTRYGAIHLSGPLLESLAAETGSSDSAFDVASLGSGEWHCEEIDDDDGMPKDHRLVRWQYTAKDGRVLHEEFAKIPVRVVSKQHGSATATVEGTGNDAEDVMAQLDFDRYSDAGSDDDLFAGFASSITPAKAQVKPNAPTQAAASSKDAVVDSTDIDDLFADLPASSVPATSVDDLFSDLPPTTTVLPTPKRVKTNKVVPTPTPPKKVEGTFVPGLDPEEDDPANFSDGYDEGAAVGPSLVSKQTINAEEERKKTLALLGAMFGSGSDEDAPVVDVAEGQEASEDEDESSVDSSSESSNSSSESEAGEVDAAEASSSSSSSSDEESDEHDDEMAIEEDVAEAPAAEEPTPVAEVEQDVSMEDATPAPVEVVAAPSDAKSRRAAFLSSLSDPASKATDAKSGSFVPIARFDPGTRSVAAPAAPVDAVAVAAPAEESAPTSDAPSTNAVQAAPDADQGTRVSMSTLKEMFRPQDRSSTSDVTAGFSLGLGAGADAAAGDAGAGFSLMDSLGLEFELEEEEPEAESLHNSAPSMWSASAYSRFQPTPAASSQEHEPAQPRKLAPFFPSSSQGASWNGTDSQGSVQRWCKPRSEDEREKDWARYKETLTQVVKKRHREAARKHKRNFRSMPKQQDQGVGAEGRT